MVSKTGPDFLVGGGRGIHPDRDYKGKVGQDVDYKGDILPEIEKLVAKNVSGESYTDCGDD